MQNESSRMFVPNSSPNFAPNFDFPQIFFEEFSCFVLLYDQRIILAEVVRSEKLQNESSRIFLALQVILVF